MLYNFRGIHDRVSEALALKQRMQLLKGCILLHGRYNVSEALALKQRMQPKYPEAPVDKTEVSEALALKQRMQLINRRS